MYHYRLCYTMPLYCTAPTVTFSCTVSTNQSRLRIPSVRARTNHVANNPVEGEAGVGIVRHQLRQKDKSPPTCSEVGLHNRLSLVDTVSPHVYSALVQYKGVVYMAGTGTLYYCGKPLSTNQSRLWSHTVRASQR